MIKDFYFLFLSMYYKIFTNNKINKFKILICSNNRIILQHTEFFKTENKNLYKHQIADYDLNIFYPSYVKKFISIKVNNNNYKKKFLKKFGNISFIFNISNGVLNLKKFNYNNVFIIANNGIVTKIIYPKKPVIKLLFLCYSCIPDLVLDLKKFTNLKCIIVTPLNNTLPHLQIALPKLYKLYLYNCDLINYKKPIKRHTYLSDMQKRQSNNLFYYRDTKNENCCIIHNKYIN